MKKRLATKSPSGLTAWNKYKSFVRRAPPRTAGVKQNRVIIYNKSSCGRPENNPGKPPVYAKLNEVNYEESVVYDSCVINVFRLRGKQKR